MEYMEYEEALGCRACGHVTKKNKCESCGFMRVFTAKEQTNPKDCPYCHGEKVDGGCIYKSCVFGPLDVLGMKIGDLVDKKIVYINMQQKKKRTGPVYCIFKDSVYVTNYIGVTESVSFPSILEVKG